MIYKVKDDAVIKFEDGEIASFITFAPRGEPWDSYNLFAFDYYGLFGKLRNGEWFTAYCSKAQFFKQIEEGKVYSRTNEREELKYKLHFST